MKILNRYLLKEVAISFLLALGLIILVLLLNDIFYLTDIFISKKVPLGIVLRVLFLLLPSILALAIPLAFLAGLLGGLTHLNADREIEALRLLGVSPQQVLKPLLGLALILCLVTMSFTFWLAPRANYKWLQTMVESVLTRTNFQVIPGQFNESFPANVIYIDSQDSQGKWHDIFLYRKEEENGVQIVTAREGEMWPAPDLKAAWLRLADGYSFRFNLSQPETIGFNQFKRQEQLVDLKNLLPSVSLEKKYREKSLKELLADWRKIKMDRNKNRGELLAIQVELNKRVSIPAACLVFVFLGLGLGWRRWPGGRVGGYGVSLIILVIYYLLLVFGQSLAEAGRLAPLVGLWLPDFLALVAGCVTYLSACREVQIGFCPGIKSLASLPKKPARIFTVSSSRRPKRSSRQVLGLGFHDRYILSKFVTLYICLFLALVLVLVVFNFLTRWEMARENRQSIYLLLSFVWHKLPEFTIQAIQLAALLAPILCLNFLYRRNEIQVMITSGVSFWRLTAPVLGVAILIIPISFFLQDRLVVRGNLEAEKIWSQLADRPVRAFTFQNRYWIKNDDLPGFVHYELSSAEMNNLQRLLIFQTENGSSFRLKRVIFSQMAKISQNSLHLENGWERDVKSENFHFYKFDTLKLNWPETQRQFVKEWKEPSLMTLKELGQYSRDLEKSGSPALNLRLEARLRVAWPFSVFVLCLLGVALAGLSQKRIFVFPLGLALGGGYLFWQTVAAFRSLGHAGILNPGIAAWSPIAIFSLVGFYLFFRVKT